MLDDARNFKLKTEVFLLCVGATILYGIIHDQVTARLCIEYFTVAHPPIFHTESPAILGFAWGIAGTVGVGVGVGVILGAMLAGAGALYRFNCLVPSKMITKIASV